MDLKKNQHPRKKSTPKPAQMPDISTRKEQLPIPWKGVCSITVFSVAIFLALWIALFVVEYKIDSLKPIPIDENDLTVFVHMSDIHLSAEERKRFGEFHTLVKSSIQTVIRPDFAAITGDLTDARQAYGQSGQTPLEWTAYATIFENDTQIPMDTSGCKHLPTSKDGKNILWVDLPGNHDTFGVEFDDAKADDGHHPSSILYYSTHSSCQSLDPSVIIRCSPSGRLHRLVRIPAVRAKRRGPRRFVHFFGVLDDDDFADVEEMLHWGSTFGDEKDIMLDADSCKNFIGTDGKLPKEMMMSFREEDIPTFAFSHFPFCVTKDRVQLENILDEHNTIAYFTGHLHRIPTLNGFARHTTGLLELVVGDFHRHNRVRIGTLYNGMFNIRDVSIPFISEWKQTGSRYAKEVSMSEDLGWPFIVPISPKESRFLSHHEPHLSVQREKVKVLFLSPSPFREGYIEINADPNLRFNLSASSPERSGGREGQVLEACWNSWVHSRDDEDVFHQRIHIMRIHVNDMDGRAGEYEYEFSLAGLARPFSFFPQTLLTLSIEDISTFMHVSSQLLFVTVLLLLPSSISHSLDPAQYFKWRVEDDPLQNSRFVVGRWFGDFFLRYCDLVRRRRFYFFLLISSTLTTFGPWFVGYLGGSRAPFTVVSILGIWWPDVGLVRTGDGWLTIALRYSILFPLLVFILSLPGCHLVDAAPANKKKKLVAQKNLSRITTWWGILLVVILLLLESHKFIFYLTAFGVVGCFLSPVVLSSGLLVFVFVPYFFMRDVHLFYGKC